MSFVFPILTALLGVSFSLVFFKGMTFAQTPTVAVSLSSDKIIVKLKSAPKARTLVSLGKSLPQGKLVSGVASKQFVVYKVTGDVDGAIKAVKNNSAVASAFRVPKVRAFKSVNDTYALSQWALDNLKLKTTGGAWDSFGADLGTKTGSVKVAVIDTGVDRDHPDIAGKIADGDWVRCDWKPGSSQETTDDIQCLAEAIDLVNKKGIDDGGHGTHVAGIIGATADNGKGVAGGGWGVSLLSIKVLDETGSGDMVVAMQAVKWAADHGAKVINMSLGAIEQNLSSDAVTFLQEFVDYAWEKGSVVVVAAGNCGYADYHNYLTPTPGQSMDGCDELGEDPLTPTPYNIYFKKHWVNPKTYPAALNHVLSVAALAKSDTRAEYSEHGSWVSVAAPGGACGGGNPIDCIISTFSRNASTAGCVNAPTSEYCYMQGTSMAAPQAAAVAALLFAANPALTNTQVKSMIETTANKSIAAGDSLNGAVDAQAAVAAALAGGGTTVPTTTPNPDVKLPRTINPYPTAPRCPSTVYTCTKKSSGDADCNDGVDETDYSVWKNQLDTIPTPQAIGNANFFCGENNGSNFYNSHFVDMVDYEVWRRGKYGNTTAFVSSTPGPTLPTSTPGVGISGGKILVLGDSITSGGYSVGFTADMWYPCILKGFLGASFEFVGSQPSYQGICGGLKHEGFGGYKTSDILGRNLDYTATTYNPDIVLIYLGINDVGLDPNFSPATSKNNLQAIADRFRSHNANVKIYLSKLPPAKTDWSNGTNAEINDLNNILSQISGATVVDQWTGFDVNTDLVGDDAIHPNVSGSRKIACNFYKVIKGTTSCP